MANPQKPKRAGTWLSKSQISGVFDISVEYFDRGIRPLMDQNHIRKIGRRVMFYGRGAIEAWARSQAPQPPAVEPSLDDLLLELQLAKWDSG